MGINLVISGLLRRGDRLESIRARTNVTIGEVCQDDMKYMEHENKLVHLNGSLLHRKKHGDSVPANNF